MESNKPSSSVHPEIKKTLMRKHIAASTTCVMSLVIAAILIFIRWRFFRTNDGDNQMWRDILMATQVIITIILFSSSLYLLFNKRGYEAEVASSSKILLPTIFVFLDLFSSFIFSVVLTFLDITNGNDPTRLVLMYTIISFGISASLLMASEFILFHSGNSRYSKVYSDD